MGTRLTRIALVGMLLVAVPACATAPAPSVATNDPSASYAPVPESRWWAVGPRVTMCGQAVTLWIRGEIRRLGSCSGLLSDQPAPITLGVGEQIGIHILTDGRQWPFPPPVSSDDGVAHLLTVADNGSTSVYQGVSEGPTRLSSQGLSCPASEQTPGQPCSFLALTVVP
jgi:hypothetical protein